jgi:hypothetical protein
MANLQTKLVAIKRLDLHLDQPGLEFHLGYTEAQIDRGARLFLEAKGFINPLVLEKTNSASDEATPSDRYKVISGFLEYFCAVRAKELDPSQEWVQAIIVSSSLADNLGEQIELFRVGADSIEVDDDLDFELDAELKEEIELYWWIDEALEGKSVEDCFAAARRVCNLYPDPADRANAIAELETLKEQASGDTSARAKSDKFFAE